MKNICAFTAETDLCVFFFVCNKVFLVSNAQKDFCAFYIFSLLLILLFNSYILAEDSSEEKMSEYHSAKALLVSIHQNIPG